MTNAVFIFKRVLKSKSTYLVAICMAATIFIFRALAIPSYSNYDIVATVYPVQMTNSCDSVINPCYKMSRILKSNDYKRCIISVSDGLLNENNYAKNFKTYETPQHLIVLHLFTKDTVQGLRLITKALDCLTDTYNSFPSSKIGSCSNLQECMITDYSWDLCDTLSVCDIVDRPYVCTSPCMARYLKLAFIALFIGLCMGVTVNIIATGIKNGLC